MSGDPILDEMKKAIWDYKNSTGRYPTEIHIGKVQMDALEKEAALHLPDRKDTGCADGSTSE